MGSIIICFKTYSHILGTMENQRNPEFTNPPPKYPIAVKCVVASLSEKNSEILKIRDFANDMNINFVMREYNSKKFSDDRHRITRLPAFHIYVNRGYRNTFYLNTRPCQIIKQIVEEEGKKSMRTWHTFYTELRNYIAPKENTKILREWP
jgi:hypothetical protein